MTDTEKEPDFKGFATRLLDITCEALDVEFEEIQNIAEHFNLVNEVKADKPCGEVNECQCLTMCGTEGFPITCLRRNF